MFICFSTKAGQADKEFGGQIIPCPAGIRGENSAADQVAVLGKERGAGSPHFRDALLHMILPAVGRRF
jgi:hypothetical protein